MVDIFDAGDDDQSEEEDDSDARNNDDDEYDKAVFESRVAVAMASDAGSDDKADNNKPGVVGRRAGGSEIRC